MSGRRDDDEGGWQARQTRAARDAEHAVEHGPQAGHATAGPSHATMGGQAPVAAAGQPASVAERQAWHHAVVWAHKWHKDFFTQRLPALQALAQTGEPGSLAAAMHADTTRMQECVALLKPFVARVAQPMSSLAPASRTPGASGALQVPDEVTLRAQTLPAKAALQEIYQASTAVWNAAHETARPRNYARMMPLPALVDVEAALALAPVTPARSSLRLPTAEDAFPAPPAATQRVLGTPSAAKRVARPPATGAAASAPQHTAPAHASAHAPLGASVQQLTFPDTAVGARSAPLPVAFAHHAAAQPQAVYLEFSGVELTTDGGGAGAFRLAPDHPFAPFTFLMPKEGVTAGVVFAPQQPGPVQGWLRVRARDGAHEHLVAVRLQGTATAAPPAAASAPAAWAGTHPGWLEQTLRQGDNVHVPVFGPPHTPTAASTAPPLTTAPAGARGELRHATPVDSYLAMHAPTLRDAVVAQLLTRVDGLPLPPEVHLADGPAFVYGLYAGLPAQATGAEVAATLGAWLGPRTLHTIVGGARGQRPGADGRMEADPNWNEAVGAAVATALEIKLRPALLAMARNFVAWEREPVSHGATLLPGDLRPASALQAAVAQAIVGTGTVDGTTLVVQTATPALRGHARRDKAAAATPAADTPAAPARPTLRVLAGVTWGAQGVPFALQPEPADASPLEVAHYLWGTAVGAEHLQRVGTVYLVPPSLAGRRGTPAQVADFALGAAEEGQMRGAATALAARGRAEDVQAEAQRVAQGTSAGGPTGATPAVALAAVEAGWASVDVAYQRLVQVLARVNLHASAQAERQRHAVEHATLASLDAAGRQARVAQYSVQYALLVQMGEVAQRLVMPPAPRQSNMAAPATGTLNGAAVTLGAGERAMLQALLEVVPLVRLAETGPQRWQAVVQGWQQAPLEAAREAVETAQTVTGAAAVGARGQAAWQWQFGNQAAADAMRVELAQLELTLATSTDPEARAHAQARLTELHRTSRTLAAGGAAVLQAQQAKVVFDLMRSHDNWLSELFASFKMIEERERYQRTASALLLRLAVVGQVIDTTLTQRHAAAARHDEAAVAAADATLQQALDTLRAEGQKAEVASLVRQAMALAKDFQTVRLVTELAVTLAITFVSAGAGALARGAALGRLVAGGAEAAAAAGTVADVAAARLMVFGAGQLAEMTVATALNTVVLNEPLGAGLLNNLVGLGTGFAALRATGKMGQAMVAAGARWGRGGQLVGHLGALTLTTATQVVVGIGTASVMELMRSGQGLTGEQLRHIALHATAMGVGGYVGHVLCAGLYQQLETLGARLGAHTVAKRDIAALRKRALRLEQSGNPHDADAVLTQAQTVMAAHAAQLGEVGQLSAAARAQRGITLDAPTLAVLQQHAATLTHEATRLQFHVMSTRAGLHALDAQTYAGRQAHVARVVASARTQGLTVTEVTANRMVALANVDGNGNVTASGAGARSQPASDASAARVSHAPVPREFVVQLPGRGAVHVLEADFAPAIATREVRTPRAATRETAGRDRLAVVAHRAVIDDVLARKGLTGLKYRVETLTAKRFEQRFGSANGGAKMEPRRNGEVVVYVRNGVRPEAIAHEAEHLYQHHLGDERTRMFSQATAAHNVHDWAQWPAAQRRDLWANALELEVQAARRELDTALAPNRPANVQSEAPERLRQRLTELEAQHETLLGISLADLGAMSAGAAPMLPLLVAPPGQFAPRPRGVVVGEGLSPLRQEATAAELARMPIVTDSPRCQAGTEVRMAGQTWQTAPMVSTGVSGQVHAIEGHLIKIAQESGRRVAIRVATEGAILVKVGQRVVAGDRIGHDGMRANRLIRVAGTPPEGAVRWVVEEQIDGKWRAAGDQSRIRGAIAEEATFARTDRDAGALLMGSAEEAQLQRAQGAARAAGHMEEAASPTAGGRQMAPREAELRASGVTGMVRIPVQNASGNGLDELTFAFRGTGDDLTAEGTVREVKDYSGSVGFESFTALRAGTAGAHLRSVARAATDAAELPVMERPEAWMRLLSSEQLAAVVRAIRYGHVKFVVVLGPSTTVSKATLVKLSAEAQKLGLRDPIVEVAPRLTAEEIGAATERMTSQAEGKLEK